MSIPSTPDSFHASPPSVGKVGRSLAWLSWKIVRLPIALMLTVLEPLVRTLLAGVALLGILISLFFQFVFNLPNFPFGLMLGISVGSALLLMVYYGLLRLFSVSETRTQ